MGPSPFRLNTNFIKEVDFKRNLDIWWNNAKEDGHRGFAFIQSLKALTKNINSWQTGKMNSMVKDKTMILKEIDAIDFREESRSMNPNDSLRRLSLKSDLSHIIVKEAQFWAQRAKKLWIKDEDENTNFFYRICFANQKRNFIYKIKDETGTSHTTDKTIADIFIRFFGALFNRSKKDLIFIENLDQNPINDSFRYSLCYPFNEEEIKYIVFSCNSNKSPRPYGFPLQFY